MAILAAVVLVGAAIATYFLAGWPTALEDEDAARAVVEEFGTRLQKVSVLADKTMAADAIAREYGDLVAPALLTEWQNDPTQAPGRVTSSPWPDHIQITSVERESRSRYLIEGDIVEVSNEGGMSGVVAEAVRRPVSISVEKQAGAWRITSVVLGVYPGEAHWISSEVTPQEFVFSYPERLPTSFVSAVEWPPAIERISGSYACAESAGDGAGVAKKEKRTPEGHEYCVSLTSEGAAGSVYNSYDYEFPLNGAMYRISFTLRLPQCLNYDEPQQGACKAEQANLNIDSIVDRIAQSITDLPAK